jgi:formylmethanofuran dehydrogenase subunit C
MLQLKLKDVPPVPLEAELISPDMLARMSLDEVRAVPLQLGKHRRRLDEFFEVGGQPGPELQLFGDLSRVKWLGRSMSHGRIEIHGNAGMHLGARMKGGEIEVFGNAGDWLGAEMLQGTIRVHGDAGGQVGAAYRGSLTGMKNGAIIIDGSAGLEIGMRMRRGLIVVGKRVKDFAGLQMKGGTILLRAGADIRAGAWMVRGTIISLAPLPVLPTFAASCSHNPLFLRLLARQLAAWGIALPSLDHQGIYDCYSGDSAVPGKGELLIWRAADRSTIQ